ncbi:MAG: hypothetical protein ACI9IO_001949, partial [Cyanobium sp.]
MRAAAQSCDALTPSCGFQQLRLQQRKIRLLADPFS